MACPVSPSVTLILSLSQTPPGMSPSAGAYLQMAVSFNYRCLALFTDTGYIWMGLATLKVSVSLPSLCWGIRVSAHPSSPSLADRSSSVGCQSKFSRGPRGLGAAGWAHCHPAIRRSTLFYSLPDFIPYSHFFYFCTHLFAGLAPPFLCPNSPQINSPPLITFSPLVTVLLHPYPNLLDLVLFSGQSDTYHHCRCGHFGIGPLLESHDSALQIPPRCAAHAGEVLFAFHVLQDQSLSFRHCSLTRPQLSMSNFLLYVQAGCVLQQWRNVFHVWFKRLCSILSLRLHQLQPWLPPELETGLGAPAGPARSAAPMLPMPIAAWTALFALPASPLSTWPSCMRDAICPCTAIPLTQLSPTAGEALRVQQQHPISAQADGLVSGLPAGLLCLWLCPPMLLWYTEPLQGSTWLCGHPLPPWGKQDPLTSPLQAWGAAAVLGLSQGSLAGACVPRAGSVPWWWPGTGS